MEDRKQGRWDKQMVATNCLRIKRDLKSIGHDDNQEIENVYHSSYVRDVFSAVCILNDLMKILVGLGKFNCVIFKDLWSECYF